MRARQAGSEVPPLRRRSALDQLSRVIESMCEIALIAMVAAVVGGVFAREALAWPVQFAEEIAGFLLVAMTFLGVSIALRDGALFRVDTFFERWPAAMRGILLLAWDVVALLFTLAVEWQLVRHVMSSYTKGTISTTASGLPLWIPQVLMPIGFALLALYLAVELTKRWSEVRAIHGEKAR